MDTLGVIGFVFGIFGFMAYLSMGQLKKKVEVLESALSGIEGTSFHEDRESLYRMAQNCIGKNVRLDLKEDHEDAAVMMYGNSKHGTITVLDCDRDWMQVRVEGPRLLKEKLIRMESISKITEE